MYPALSKDDYHEDKINPCSLVNGFTSVVDTLSEIESGLHSLFPVSNAVMADAEIESPPSWMISCGFTKPLTGEENLTSQIRETSPDYF
jgi:hypothetical protein